MKLKVNILFLSFMILNTMTSYIGAQDLSTLTEAQRNNKLIEIAKNVYKAPRLKNFYREYGTPTITAQKTIEATGDAYNKLYNDPKTSWYGSKPNQKFYIVYFPYDKSKESFTADYAAKVYIWEKTGEAFMIGLGNMLMYTVKDGKIPNYDKQPEPEKYYTITYSKDMPLYYNKSLPQKGKFGDIVTIVLKTVTTEAWDGWTTEQGFNFNPDKDLKNGQVISDEIRSEARSIDVRTIKIMVTGDMTVNVTAYKEEYDALF